MFWNHRPPPHPLPPALHGSTEGQALLGLLTLQPLFWLNSQASPHHHQGLMGSLGLPAQSLNLEREVGPGNALSPGGTLSLEPAEPCAHGWVQFAGTAVALFAGGNGEASLAFFAFFFFFFF